MQKIFVLLLFICLCGFSTRTKAAEYWAVGIADDQTNSIIFTVSTNEIDAGVSDGPYSTIIPARLACIEFFNAYQKEKNMYDIKLVNKCTETKEIK